MLVLLTIPSNLSKKTKNNINQQQLCASILTGFLCSRDQRMFSFNLNHHSFMKNWDNLSSLAEQILEFILFSVQEILHLICFLFQRYLSWFCSQSQKYLSLFCSHSHAELLELALFAVTEILELTVAEELKLILFSVTAYTLTYTHTPAHIHTHEYALDTHTAGKKCGGLGRGL